MKKFLIVALVCFSALVVMAMVSPVNAEAKACVIGCSPGVKPPGWSHVPGQGRTPKPGWSRGWLNIFGLGGHRPPGWSHSNPGQGGTHPPGWSHNNPGQGGSHNPGDGPGIPGGKSLR